MEDQKRVTEFTIDRKTWFRGHPSQMLDSRGMKCCLGHYGTACGLENSQMVGLFTPVFVSRKVGFIPPGFEFLVKRGDAEEGPVTTPACSLLMRENDRVLTNDVFKEKIITELFAEQGIKVTFIN